MLIKENLETIELTNKIGLKVTLAPLGASIYSIEYQNKQVTLTPNFDDWKKDSLYHGKTIGRVGNRIKGNKISCDDQEYTIENNEGPNTLHGGIHGISSCVFDYKIDNYSDYTKVEFSYISPDGESGFPGTLCLKVIYQIFENEAKIKLSFIANTDKTTLCSLTNHAFFMMGEQNLDNLKLTIKGTNYIVPNKDDLIAIKVERTPEYLDFSSSKSTCKDINNPVLMDGRTQGYDHHYFFNDVDINISQIILEGAKLKLTIYTDYSGAQIYSDNYKDDIKFLGTNYHVRRGIAIEPQESHLELHYLKPKETYKHTIIYVIENL